MAVKVFKKRGTPNHNQRKMIKDLQEYFEANPGKAENIVVATDDDSLKSLHAQYCAEEVEFTEIKNDGTTTTHKPNMENESHENFRDSMGGEDDPDSEDEYAPRVDPMNRHEPIIRDYVKEDGFQQETGQKPPAASSYDEPTNFKDSFDIPDDTIQPDQKQQGPINSQPIKPKAPTPADPDAKIKRKSKKKFTKYAVDAVCALAGRGIVWWATKDITDASLQKAITDDEITEASLKMLVYLDHSTQGTVKQFFELQILAAQDLANFTPEEKEDLAEALEDFMEFKKIEINPTINLGVIFLGMVFERAMKAMENKAQTGSILIQLKNMHALGISGTQQNNEPDLATEEPDPDPASSEEVIESPMAETEPEQTQS